MASRALLYICLVGLVATATATKGSGHHHHGFKNKGGPPFLNGFAQELDAEGDIVSQGLTLGNQYTFAYAAAGNKGVVTQTAVYQSWECVKGQPGHYRALLVTKTTDAKGRTKTSLECEYGSVEDGTNMWASQPAKKGCPTKTTTENRLIGTKEVPLKPNTC